MSRIALEQFKRIDALLDMHASGDSHLTERSAVLRTVLMDMIRGVPGERLEVMETGRRRRWSEDEKLRIVLEGLHAPRQVAAMTRRYGVSRSLLLRWRQLFRLEPQDGTERHAGFVPARARSQGPCLVRAARRAAG